MWRGLALADVASESFARADAERLNELRAAATEDLMGSELAVGRDDLVPELKSLVAQDPLRERLRGFLMVALYREGRQAEALDAYERTRAVLAEELGIDPSHELQELHRRVLAQDPTLRAATPTLTRSEDHDEPGHTDAPVTSTVPARRRFGLVLAGLIVALALVAIGLVTLNHGPATPTSAAGRSAVALLGDATDAPASQIVVDGSASAIAADGPELWVADGNAGTVTRIHTDTRTSELPVSSVIDPIAITAGDGRAWVLDPYAGGIKALDASGQVDTGFDWHSPAPVDAVFAHGSLWVVDATCECVYQADGSTGKRERTITAPFAGEGPVRIDAGPGVIWVLNGIGRSLVRISPWNGRPVGAPISLAYQPADLAVSKDTVWVSMEANDLVEKLSLSGVSEGDIRVPGGPSTIVADASGAWVLTSRGGQVIRLVGQDGSRVRLAAPPAALAIGDGGAWVALTRP